MKCDFCDNDASIEFVVFNDGKPQTIRMCVSCYKKRLEEMAAQLPGEWGGELLASRLKAFMDQVDPNGQLFKGMTFTINQGDSGQPVINFGESAFASDEDADGGDAPNSGAGLGAFAMEANGLKDAFNALFRQTSGMSGEADERTDAAGQAPTAADKTVRTAREIALDNQRKQMVLQKRRLTQELSEAIEAEAYERCAQIREALAELGDALIHLDEERKHTDGL